MISTDEGEIFDLMTKWIERYRREADERFQRLDDVLRDPSRRDHRNDQAHTHAPPPAATHPRSDGMTTITDPTWIDIDQKVPAVHITREFDHPVSKVFRAHVDAE